jgi:SAM-dependent methyltransferase
VEKQKEVLMDFICEICDNKEGNKFYTVREMQFGTRDEFIYCECGNCGCVQLVNPPANLSKYYPGEYFSFKIFKENLFKEKLNVYRDRYSFGIRSLTGEILYKKLGEPTYIGWLKYANVNLESKILDVGCGNGKLLYRMGNLGFKNLIGIDNFIDEDIVYKNGAKIFKKSLSGINEKFDLIMMHHSLEHMENQHQVFAKLAEILLPGKFLMIRIPTSSSFAWRNYKENWFSLDAPRHFFLHSLSSIRLLVDKYGFEIVKAGYDSRSIQLWGSEQYKMDVPLMDTRSYFVNERNPIYTQEQVNLYEQETVKLNARGDGDQVVLFLRKL